MTEATQSMSGPIRLSAAAMGKCLSSAGCTCSAEPVAACCALCCCPKSLLRAQYLYKFHPGKLLTADAVRTGAAAVMKGGQPLTHTTKRRIPMHGESHL
jgi:hypothetical protein